MLTLEGYLDALALDLPCFILQVPALLDPPQVCFCLKKYRFADFFDLASEATNFQNGIKKIVES